MPVKRTQVVCDCGTEVVKVVLSQGRIRVLSYGRSGFFSWFVGKQIFREDRRSATHQMPFDSKGSSASLILMTPSIQS